MNMLIIGFILGILIGVLIGVLIGLKIATATLGIPKGYKVGTVTFKKIED